MLVVVNVRGGAYYVFFLYKQILNLVDELVWMFFI